MSRLLFSIAIYTLIALLALLGIHHFIKARRGLRTGAVNGLMVGYSGRRYDRTGDPRAYWVNVWAGFFVAGFAAIVVLWAIVATVMGISDFYGYGAL